MDTKGMLRRAMTLSAAGLLAIGLMGWVAVAPTNAASTTLTVYQSANYTGASWTTSTSAQPDLSTIPGPCQKYFWETRTWNDCVSSWKFTNLSGSTMSLTFYTDTNYNYYQETSYCLRSGYTWVVPNVYYNHQFSSYRWIVNNLGC